jgi:predicted membrane-bound spermidine synthase
MHRLLCMVFFLSGAAALLFENLWFQRAGLAFGNSVWASSLVLAAFMGGLALGNGLAGWLGPRVRRPARAYGLLELVIAATGVAIVLGMPVATPLVAQALRPLADAPLLAHAVRLGAAFAILLLPATAMGATLPLLVAELHRSDPRFGLALGRLYGWNTLGAVVGAVAGEAALLAWLGVRGTAYVAGGLNLVAAAGAFFVAHRVAVRAPAPVPVAPPPLPRRTAPLLAAAFAAGGVLLGLEVIWFRFLTLFTLPGSLAFAWMLAVVLLGIGLGGLLGGRWLARHAGAAQLAPALLAAAALLCVGSYAGFEHVLARLSVAARLAWWGVLVQGLALMLPVSLASGVLFTLLGEALDREAPAGTRSAGLLTLANTTGAMLGALAAGFVLLPGLGIERSLRLLAAVYLAAAVLLWLFALRPAGRRQAVALAFALGGAALAVGPLFPAGRMQSRYLHVPIESFLATGDAHVAAVRESLTETILYLRTDVLGEPHHYRLVTNSHSMSSTLFNAQRYMRLFVWLPVALHPEPRRALLISYGVGTTAKALTDTRELERIDVVDVSRDIVEMNDIVWDDPAQHPARDPRVRVHIEDGRHFLQTRDERYDLITGEPPPPKNAGIVSLYTREFFALARGRLADGGWLSYWLPVHAFQPAEAYAVIHAFCDVFPDCSLWSGSGLDWILLGSRGAGGPIPADRFTAQWRDPVVAGRMRALGVEIPEQLGTLYLAGPEELREIARATPPLVDDWPKRLGGAALEVAEAQAIWRRWLDPDTQRARFAASPLVARLWPPALRDATLPWFAWSREVEDAMHASLLETHDPARDLAAVDRVLDDTPLRTLALWHIGSNDDLQRAIERAEERGRGGHLVPFARGAEALAARDWAEATRAFRLAYGIEREWRAMLYWWLYALARDGRFEEAARTAERQGVDAGREPEDAAVWRFLRNRFPDLARTNGASAEAPPDGMREATWRRACCRFSE